MRTFVGVEKNLAGYLCISTLLFTLKQFNHGKHFVYHRGDTRYYLGNFIPGWFFYRGNHSHPLSDCGNNDHFKIS